MAFLPPCYPYFVLLVHLPTGDNLHAVVSAQRPRRTGGRWWRPGGRTPALPVAPLRPPLLHVVLPRRLHLPAAAHRHQVPLARRYGHRLHPADRVVPRPGVRLLGPTVECAGAASHHSGHCGDRLCAGRCSAWPTGTCAFRKHYHLKIHYFLGDG